MNYDLSHCEKYWLNEGGEYALLKSDELLGEPSSGQGLRIDRESYSIVWKKRAMIIVIENDEIAREVIRRMLNARVPIISQSDFRSLINQVKDIIIDTTDKCRRD